MTLKRRCISCGFRMGLFGPTTSCALRLCLSGKQLLPSSTCVSEIQWLKFLAPTFPGDSYVQACVSTKIGGLGIRRVVDHADGAFIASWHFARLFCKEEKWVTPTLCGSGFSPQSVASESTDVKTWNSLISRASPRDAQRLRCLDQACELVDLCAPFCCGRQ